MRKTNFVSRVILTAILFLSCCMAGISANIETTVNGIVFQIPDANVLECMASGYTDGLPSNLVIPEQISYEGKTYAVTQIKKSAFRKCSNLTSVVIPSCVKTVGGYAFYNCSNLRSVTISSKETNIGYCTFAVCPNINSVTLPIRDYIGHFNDSKNISEVKVVPERTLNVSKNISEAKVVPENNLNDSKNISETTVAPEKNLQTNATTPQTKTKTTAEYLTSAGFTQVNDSTWAIADRATVTMQGNYVKAFEATQNHNWTMTFGNGSKQGAVVNVKSGEKVTFANGRITFGNGSSYCPASLGTDIMLKRSILRSPIFNASRNALFATDVKVVNPNTASLGKYFPSNGSEGYSLDAYGNFSDKVAAANAALQNKRDNNLSMVKNTIDRGNAAEQEALYKKYGRNVIEGVQNGNIMVGAPIELVMEMMGKKNIGTDFSYCSKVVSSNATSETRLFTPEVYSPNEWHSHFYVTYNKRTKCVTSYRRFKDFY